MITKVMTRNFRGFDIDVELKRLNLLVGPNGSGKSAVSGAIMVAQMGYIPGYGKANAEIFSSYGTKDTKKIVCGIQLENGADLERSFIKRKKGTVSQKYSIDGINNFDKADFAVAMSKAPKIFDIYNFKALSDQKKLDLIFNLYPPAGDPKKISSEIGKKEARKNKVLDEIRGQKILIANLAESRADMDLPPGSLASIKTEIHDVKRQIRTAVANLDAEKKKIIEAEAKAKAEKEAEERQRALDESRAKGMQQTQLPDQKTTTEQKSNLQKDMDSMDDFLAKQRQDAEQSLMAKNKRAGIGQMPTAVESIKNILEIIDKVGCGACAAKTACIAELNKHKKFEKEVNDIIF